MGTRVVPLKSFICFEAFLGIGMKMFSRHCFGVSFWFRAVFFISRIAECKKSLSYFKASTVITSSEPGNLSFFIDFIAVMSSSFKKFDIFIFRSCGAFGMFDVSTKSLELFKSSSKYFPHSSINSSLFAGGSPFLFFHVYCTVSLYKKIKFSIKDFLSKCDEICRKLRIWSHLLKKSLMENFIFCSMFVVDFPVMSLMMENTLDNFVSWCCFGFNTLLLQIIILVVHHWLFNSYCSLLPWQVNVVISMIVNFLRISFRSSIKLSVFSPTQVSLVFSFRKNWIAAFFLQFR